VYMVKAARSVAESQARIYFLALPCPLQRKGTLSDCATAQATEVSGALGPFALPVDVLPEDSV